MNHCAITLLGTNGWYDTDTGNTICTLIDCPEGYIILDAGNGLHKAAGHLREKKPVFIFLSHYHLDHIQGLHALALLPVKDSLTFIVRNGTTAVLEGFLDEPFTVKRTSLPWETKILEVPDQIDRLPFRAEVLPMVHSVDNIGLRVETCGKTIAYCPDTGYCGNAVTLSKGADLVISECAYLPGEDHMEWPHLNPETAAAIARDAGAMKLVLTHFDASRYTGPSLRETAEKTAGKIFPNVIAGYDGMVIEL